MIAIVVPSVNRADKLAPLVENIHQATANEHEIYLIIERTDVASIKAAIGLDATQVIGTFGAFAKAANHGYRMSTEPFIMFGNDDCVWRDGWDTAALTHFSDTTHIVGLDDGHGDCKCFQIVRRSYIEQHSGVFDKPNIVYHEYQSQCPDTELAFYAQFRAVWGEAPEATIEHRHWRFGQADRDHPNYHKVAETIADDLAEYERRRELWDPDHLTPDCVPAVAV